MPRADSVESAGSSEIEKGSKNISCKFPALLQIPRTLQVQHSNAKNAVLFEAIALIIHMDNEPNLLVRACNQLGAFLTHRETNLRYLALESMCLLSTSEFSHEVNLFIDFLTSISDYFS